MDNINPLQAFRDIAGPNRYELRCYPAPGRRRAPFALLCPGGGYACVMSSIEGIPYAKALNEQGYTAFVLRYRVRQKGRFPAPMLDIARAVQHIADNAEKYHVQMEGYSVWGSSAGGHLAGCFGTKTLGYEKYHLPRPSALVLCYPVVTMGEATHAGSCMNLLGEQPSAKLVERTSLERQITSSYPPTYLWNSAEDAEVAPTNSQMLDDALCAANVHHQYHCYDTGKHGCGLAQGTPCEGWFAEALAFWDACRNEQKA